MNCRRATLPPQVTTTLNVPPDSRISGCGQLCCRAAVKQEEAVEDNFNASMTFARLGIFPA
jgi:hypothetical protein